MNQLDFAVAFLLIISTITYSVVSVSNRLSSDFSTFNMKRLDEAASSLSTQLLQIQDSKSLVENFKMLRASFQEAGSYTHTAAIDVAIAPAMGNVHVYDDFLNEIPSTSSGNGNSMTISFSLELSADEKKYVRIIYDGSPTESVSYASNSTENNVTATILSEEDVSVLSQSKCSNLKLLSYDGAKSVLGFSDNFRISECDYGPSEPESANVVVKSIPMLIERPDGSVYSNFVRIRVW